MYLRKFHEQVVYYLSDRSISNGDTFIFDASVISQKYENDEIDGNVYFCLLYVFVRYEQDLLKTYSLLEVISLFYEYDIVKIVEYFKCYCERKVLTRDIFIVENLKTENIKNENIKNENIKKVRDIYDPKLHLKYKFHNKVSYDFCLRMKVPINRNIRKLKENKPSSLSKITIIEDEEELSC